MSKSKEPFNLDDILTYHGHRGGKAVIGMSDAPIIEVEKIEAAIKQLRIMDACGCEPDALHKLGLMILHGLYRYHVGEFPTPTDEIDKK